MPAPRSISRLLWLVATATIVYLSLYPFAGWQLRHPSALAFLGTWPLRLYSVVDFIGNVAAYLAFGLLALLATGRRGHPLRSVLLASLLALLLSLAMESVQAWLPRRVPSVLDLMANTLGGLLGALVGWLLLWCRRRWPQLGLVRLQAGSPTPVAVLLLLLWLCSQLPLQRVVFATGQMAWLQGWLAPGWDLSPLLEPLTILVAMMLPAVVVMDCLERPAARFRTLAVILVTGLALRLMAGGSAYPDLSMVGWISPSTQAGLLLGVLGWYLLGAFGQRGRLGVGMALALLQVALVNGLPADPYYPTGLPGLRGTLGAAWTPALRHLLQAVAALWPLLLLLWCVVRLTTPAPAAAALQPDPPNRSL